MKTMQIVRKISLAFIFGIMSTVPGVALASDDSSADIGEGFFNQLKSSKGLILRVEIDEQGRENTDTAVMRVYEGQDTQLSAGELATAWTRSEDASSQPEVTPADIARDSSTWGFHRYRHFGWTYPYYYYSYTPTYYYYGSYLYPTYQPIYYSTYYPYGYRYYYWGW